MRTEASKESRDDNLDGDAVGRRFTPENLSTEIIPKLKMNLAITRLDEVINFACEKPMFYPSTMFKKMQCFGRA